MNLFAGYIFPEDRFYVYDRSSVNSIQGFDMYLFPSILNSLTIVAPSRLGLALFSGQNSNFGQSGFSLGCSDVTNFRFYRLYGNNTIFRYGRNESNQQYFRQESHRLIRSKRLQHQLSSTGSFHPEWTVLPVSSDMCIPPPFHKMIL